MTRERLLFSLIFFICAILSGVAFYYNFVERVPICPLCSLQLICYYLIGIISLFGFFHSPERSGIMVYTILILLFVVLGASFAARQLWMQHLPAAKFIPCGPTISHMLANLPLSKVLHNIFYRVDSCSLVNWTFLGLSMAAWSLFFYVIIAIITIVDAFMSKLHFFDPE